MDNCFNFSSETVGDAMLNSAALNRRTNGGHSSRAPTERVMVTRGGVESSATWRSETGYCKAHIISSYRRLGIQGCYQL